MLWNISSWCHLYYNSYEQVPYQSLSFFSLLKLITQKKNAHFVMLLRNCKSLHPENLPMLENLITDYKALMVETLSKNAKHFLTDAFFTSTNFAGGGYVSVSVCCLFPM